MRKYILLTSKPWHDSLYKRLSDRPSEVWLRMQNKDEFCFERLTELNPERIFIPHWSHIIPAKIHENFECVVFHMTDLPYGRGGSPLQNLIVRGHTETKVSAIRVKKGLDTGEVYLKKPLKLDGTAREIFERSVPIIYEMIEAIIQKNIIPKPQEGVATPFMRRRPEDGDLSQTTTIEEMYDYIRMLDCEDYPKAFFEIGNFRLEFSKADFQGDQKLNAHVSISKK